MGRVSGNKERKFEKSRNVVQFVYYVLAIVFISITIWYTFILPNYNLPPKEFINITIP